METDQDVLSSSFGALSLFFYPNQTHALSRLEQVKRVCCLLRLSVSKFVSGDVAGVKLFVRSSLVVASCNNNSNVQLKSSPFRHYQVDCIDRLFAGLLNTN